MHRRPLVSLFAALLLATCGAASAQDAFTSRPMNVRAGPNRSYPLVAQLGAGAPLDVHGCLSDWSWCDVSFDGNRGWMYSGGLSFVYNGERVPLYSYGPSLGLPIITFSLMTYWNDYYRGRPWYSQRNVWVNRRMPAHMRPPGRPHAGGPPPMAHGPHAMPAYRGSREEARGRGTPEMRGAPERRGAPQMRGTPHGRSAEPARGGHAQQRRSPPSSRGGSDRRQQGGGDRRQGPP